MLNRIKKWHSTFLKYLVSYSVMLLIPLMIMGFMIFKDFLKVFETQVAENNLNVLMDISNSIDLKFEEMRKISVRISSNWKLNPFILKQDSYNAIEAVEELKDYRSTNGFVSDLLLYIRGYGKIYGSSGTYDLDTYDGNLKRYVNATRDIFINDLETAEYPMIRPYARENADLPAASNELPDHISYLCPIPPYEAYNLGTVVFLIEETSLKSMLNASQSRFGGNTVIIDSEGSVIVSRNDSLLDTAEFRQLSRNITQNGWTTVKLKGVTYFSAHIKSDKNNWTYISLIPANQLMKSVLQAQNKVFYVLIAILIIGGILIYLFMNINYTPLARLKRKIEGNMHANIDDMGGMKVLDSVFDRIFLSNTELIKKVGDYKILMRRQLFISAINGQIRNWSDFNVIGKEIGVELEGSLFRIMMIKLNAASNASSEEYSNIKNDVMDALENKLKNENNICCYGLNILKDDVIAFVMSYSSVDMENYTQTVIAGLSAFIKSKWSLNAIIAISNVYDDIAQIQKGYIEASTALDYSKANEKDNIVFYNSIDQIVTNIHWYNSEDLKRLENEIRQGNAAGVDCIIKKMIHVINNRLFPAFLLKCMYYEIVNIIIKVCNEINIDVSKSDFHYLNIINLTVTEDMKQFRDILDCIIEYICNYIKDLKKGSEKNIDEVIKYINERYTDSGFSVQELADKVGYSYNYLCRYFKDHTGYNLSDYIARLRIERFKELVRETGDAVSVIVKKVGYENVSSFNRKFKEMEGVTPGQYKEFSKYNSDSGKISN